MSAQVESMAYVGEVPWHGLGVKVEPDLSPDEMLIRAGLDWQVIKHKCYTHANSTKANPTVEIPWNALYLQRNEAKAPLEFLGTCGPNYIPTQNKEAFRFFKRFVEAGDMKMHTAGSLNGNKMVWGLAEIGDSFVLPGKDKVEGYMLVSNPHEYGRSLTVAFTPVRVVCMNTLMMALGSATDRARHPHSTRFDNKAIAKAEACLGIAKAQFQAYKAQCQLLAKTKITEDIRRLYVAKLFSPKAVQGWGPHIGDFKTAELDESRLGVISHEIIKNIKESPGAKLKSANDTLWGCVNGITHYYDYKYGTSNQDYRLYHSWQGMNRNKKENAHKLAVAMAMAA